MRVGRLDRVHSNLYVVGRPLANENVLSLQNEPHHEKYINCWIDMVNEAGTVAHRIESEGRNGCMKRKKKDESRRFTCLRLEVQLLEEKKKHSSRM